jgi:parvulin-like peptidyl-prolyl isomerase
LSGVISPSRLVIAAASLALLSGCATFSDDDVAARVGDAELTEDQMAAMLRESAGEEAVVAPMTDAGQIVNDFVLDQALRADLAAAGAPLPDIESELTRVTLRESAGQAFAAWQVTAPTAVEPETVRALYERGPVDSNITCTAHILVETEATAGEVLGRLDDGEGFAARASEYSLDPGSAVRGGALPCDTTGNFTNSYIPEYVGAALDADLGVPVGPVESQFGFHVIIVRPYDDLGSDELDVILAQPLIRFGLVVGELDIYVNPRYGTFDPARGVVPLG